MILPGRTGLNDAALANDAAAADPRLAAGDNPNQGDEEGFTPLHFAAHEAAADVGYSSIMAQAWMP
jgi:ankyrin repeat protein